MNPRADNAELTKHAIDEWFHRVSEGQAAVLRLDAEMEKVKNNQQNIQNNLLPAKAAQAASIEEEVARLKMLLKSLRLQTEIEISEDNCSVVRKNIHQLSNKHSDLKVELNRTDAHILHLERVCGLTGLKEELRSALRQLEMTTANQGNINTIRDALGKLEQDDPLSPHIQNYKSIIAQHERYQKESNELIQSSQEKIEKLQARLNDAHDSNTEFVSLSRQLTSMRNNRISQQAELEAVSVEIIRLQGVLTELETSRANLHADCIKETFAETTMDEEVIVDQFVDKVNQLNQLQLEIDEHKTSLSQCQENIDRIDSERSKLIDEMKNHFADDYLNHLWNHPSVLIDNLIADIRRQLTAYEDAHPANQPYYVQLALVELERGVDYIERIEAEDVLARRKKYYELVGLLHRVQDQNATIYSQGLDAVIATVLAKHRIPADEAKESYDDLCHANPVTLARLTTQSVDQYLNQKYALVRQQLRAAFAECCHRGLPEWDNLFKKGVAVLAEIENEKLTCCQNNDKSFDTKFYTKLLSKTAQVMREPQNEILREEYKQLASHNKLGRASLSAKLAGAMLALIGAAVVAAAIVADVMSLGASISVSWTAKIGGSVACLMGVGLFASGTQNGLARASDNFEAAAKGVNKAQSARSARTERPLPNVHTPLLSSRR